MLSNWEVPGKHITFRNSCFEIPCWKKSLAVIHSMLSPNRNGCDHHMNCNPGHFVLRFLQRKSSKVHSDQMVPAESDQLVEFDGIWGLNTHSAKCVFFFTIAAEAQVPKKTLTFWPWKSGSSRPWNPWNLTWAARVGPLKATCSLLNDHFC